MAYLVFITIKFCFTYFVFVLPKVDPPPKVVDVLVAPNKPVVPVLAGLLANNPPLELAVPNPVLPNPVDALEVPKAELVLPKRLPEVLLLLVLLF